MSGSKLGPACAPGENPERGAHGGLLSRTAPLPAQEAEGDPRPRAVGEVRARRSEGAVRQRREIPDEAEFFDAFDDLHRGGLEDAPVFGQA